MSDRDAAKQPRGRSSSGVAGAGAGDTRPLPLRIARRRFWLWAIGLGAMSAILVIGGPFNAYVDFPQFWYAGKLVGTPDLLDPARQGAWEVAHGFKPWEFLYPPGTAWLYRPERAPRHAAGFDRDRRPAA